MSGSPSAPGRKQLRDFGLLTGAVTALLFGAVLPWAGSRPHPVWPWIVGAILGLWALTIPASLAPLYRVWMKLGHLLGWINTRIILGVVFYGLVAPMGFVMRLVGRDPMRRGFERNLASYRVPTAAKSNKHLERPF